MKKYHFTEAQFQELQGDSRRFIHQVSPSTLKLTKDFKKEFWEQYLEEVNPRPERSSSTLLRPRNSRRQANPLPIK